MCYRKKKINKNIFIFILDILLCPCIYTKNYINKRNHLKKEGHIVDKPKDYSPSKYGYIKSHGMFDVGTYYKYGKTWDKF